MQSQKESFDLMNRLKIIRRATNLNDNKSLIIHPWSTIYAEYPYKMKKRNGIKGYHVKVVGGD